VPCAATCVKHIECAKKSRYDLKRYSSFNFGSKQKVKCGKQCTDSTTKLHRINSPRLTTVHKNLNKVLKVVRQLALLIMAAFNAMG